MTDKAIAAVALPLSVRNSLMTSNCKAGRLVYHFAEILDNASVDDSHRSILADMLQYYIEQFKKAACDLWTDRANISEGELLNQATPLPTSQLPGKAQQQSSAGLNSRKNGEETNLPGSGKARYNRPQRDPTPDHDRTSSSINVNFSRLTNTFPGALQPIDTRSSPQSQDFTIFYTPNILFVTQLISQPSPSDPFGGTLHSANTNLNQLNSDVASSSIPIPRSDNLASVSPLSGSGSATTLTLLPSGKTLPPRALQPTAEIPAEVTRSTDLIGTPKRRRAGSSYSDSSLSSQGQINQDRRGGLFRGDQSSRLPSTSPLSSPEPSKGLNPKSHLNGPEHKKQRAPVTKRSSLTDNPPPKPALRKADSDKPKSKARPTVKQLAAKSKGNASGKTSTKRQTAASLFGLSKQLSQNSTTSNRNVDVEENHSASRVAAENLPSGAFERLHYWEQTKNKPADPFKTPKFIANADMIISQLPKILGRRIRTRPAIARRLIETSPADPLLGSSFINREALSTNHPAYQKVLRHPLYPCLSFTQEPLSHGWSRMIATLADIQSILTSERLRLTLASLEGIDGQSEDALLKMHTYFQDLAASFNVRKTTQPLNPNIPKDYFGSHGGMAYFFEYVASALCALISFRLDDAEKGRKQPFILSKATNKKKSNCLTKGLACLSQLLVIGPGAIFSQPTARDLCPQWKSSMLLEFGAIAVESKLKNFHEPSRPIWNPFGNTRLHILKTFAQMGFGREIPINWTNLLKVFEEKFSASRLANIIWEDIVLITDRELTEDNRVEWADKL
ncbi:hypothetical protein MJO29_010898 [Puccinia striiformis f. sp. tritici]|nr:hypothetical protein MJO29_010898 [Puccinia striiformis f. sp. tritici]